ncbi:hypothetical protein Tco_1035932, partial [Tanacetum coccineum]
SQNHKLEQQKNKAKAEVAFLISQPSYPNVTQLTELLLKELPSKFNELTGEVKELKKHVHDLEIEDPLDKLNDLARKKRKHADDIHDLFKSTTKFKSYVQYGDHLVGTVLNEPILEIFFRLHQGPGLDDHARTFSSLLLAEVDKRNLNPLKQMRTIEQQRQ